MKPARVYVALGSNIYPRAAYLRNGIKSLQRMGVAVDAVSSLYRTSPVGNTGQDFFLNAVIRGKTILEPLELMEILLRIEQEEGRHRKEKGGPRTLDLDLLLHGGTRMQTPRLILPHPRMTRRKFVLVPLLEISPRKKSPEGIPYAEKLKKIPAAQKIRRYREKWV